MKKFILFSMIAIAIATNVQAASAATTRDAITSNVFHNNAGPAKKHHHRRHHHRPHHPMHHPA
jgi:hypothetical protein